MINGTTKNIYLLRHGKVEGKAALNGVSDVLVHPELQQQICDALVQHDVVFDSVITSPLRRCSDLANLYSERMSVPLSVAEGFQEMNFGEVDGIPFDALEDKWAMLDTFWQDPANHQLTGAESLQSFHDRVTQAWSQLLDDPSDNLLLVTHGGVIRILLAHCLDIDWKNPSLYSKLSIENASITHIEITQFAQSFISVKSIGLPVL
ncbi:histidine phosphatase family protein [Vibrio sp. 10N.261.46.E12]|uniref:histidine phosphatase family protein n=1 Tax=unclassified Vibrio TaxID=2614977 RepID=UPI0009772269|nr:MULTISPECIES: histidine phosphatase family protein [unclassified Vibrio]OMO37920.1 alpha-ribazole phosphatase [Vibrio sp. 10N.261.45.E1]PMJ25016.1 alpha-ribazole phosphatase [Vibrio sp. 10N.286.45.B6]PML93808.1 alpha-ribazole phosphatase [Vibrio sp. 10N.261.49.E11]PMM68126.1 alpha-ribazole phosphatase [Vibrio sp. 10N.261.46.F12]PMM90123.1 alpha-ribazole phosphatase [Vibrio sp. 10N.261.46.E8]